MVAKLSTTDILDQIILCCGRAAVYIVGCLEPPWALPSVCQQQLLTQVMTVKNVSRHWQVFSRITGLQQYLGALPKQPLPFLICRFFCSACFLFWILSLPFPAWPLFPLHSWAQLAPCHRSIAWTSELGLVLIVPDTFLPLSSSLSTILLLMSMFLGPSLYWVLGTQ